MTISASLVKELRDLTGAGMMDCKRALEATGGDVEEARRLLREKGLASAGKRAGRETTEGKVVSTVRDGERGAMVAVGCETEPVSKNEDFLAFARRALEVVEAEGPEAVGDLEEDRVELVARLGENVAVRGAARMTAEIGEAVAAYVHPPAEKIGVLVRLRGAADVARLAAMHISFANPTYRSRHEVPEEEVAEERAVLEKTPEVGSKPEHIRPKIVEGMLAKRFFGESVLVEQPWIHDTSLTVGKALAERGAEVRRFVRLSVAG